MILTMSNFSRLKVGDFLKFVHAYRHDTSHYRDLWDYVKVLNFPPGYNYRFQYEYKIKVNDSLTTQVGGWNSEAEPLDCWEWISKGELSWFDIWEGKNDP